MSGGGGFDGGYGGGGYGGSVFGGELGSTVYVYGTQSSSGSSGSASLSVGSSGLPSGLGGLSGFNFDFSALADFDFSALADVDWSGLEDYLETVADDSPAEDEIIVNGVRINVGDAQVLTYPEFLSRYGHFDDAVGSFLELPSGSTLIDGDGNVVQGFGDDGETEAFDGSNDVLGDRSDGNASDPSTIPQNDGLVNGDRDGIPDSFEGGYIILPDGTVIAIPCPGCVS